jgi:hypothetical protein
LAGWCSSSTTQPRDHVFERKNIRQLEAKVPPDQKSEAIEAIEENPYDSRGIQEEYVGHNQDPELVGLLKKIAQKCDGVFEKEGQGAESEEEGSKRSFGKGMFDKHAGGLKMKKARVRDNRSLLTECVSVFVN